jgi:hypothetical protein
MFCMLLAAFQAADKWRAKRSALIKKLKENKSNRSSRHVYLGVLRIAAAAPALSLTTLVRVSRTCGPFPRVHVPASWLLLLLTILLLLLLMQATTSCVCWE